MNKMKLLSVFLMCAAIAGVAVARINVINIDINGYGDESPYRGGEGAYPGGNIWRVYYGGWGRGIGCERSANLATDNVTDVNWSSIYGAQVFIGDPGLNHYYRGGDPNNPGLMNDGFIEDVNNPSSDPSLQIWGREAYTGTFDIYVYGANEGDFILSGGNYGDPCTKSVTGGYPGGDFVEGRDYVVFRDVEIANGYNDGRITLTYTKTLNALQLVKLKDAAAIRVPAEGADPNVWIPVWPWDECGEYNNRAGYQGGNAESAYFGPSEYTYNDGNFPEFNGVLPLIGYFDHWEYAMYDIDVQEAGTYELSVLLFVRAQNCDSLGFLVDGKHVGRTGNVSQFPAKTSPPYDETSLREPAPADRITVNLFPGEHTVGWIINRLSGSVQTGYSIAGMYVRYKGDVEMPDCNAVTTYGYNYDADLNKDCVVDEADLGLFTDRWLNSNNP